MAPGRSSIAMAAVFVAFLVVSLSGPGPVLGAMGKEQAVGNATAPAIPRGRGDRCVADTEFMRRNHMTMLQHQRDATMREGIRSKQFSLSECIACHAVMGPDEKPVSIVNPNHFCRACHDYAAVSIDCFQCHASRPDAEAVSMAGLARP